MIAWLEGLSPTVGSLLLAGGFGALLLVAAIISRSSRRSERPVSAIRPNAGSEDRRAAERHSGGGGRSASRPLTGEQDDGLTPF